MTIAIVKAVRNSDGSLKPLVEGEVVDAYSFNGSLFGSKEEAMEEELLSVALGGIEEDLPKVLDAGGLNLSAFNEGIQAYSDWEFQDRIVTDIVDSVKHALTYRNYDTSALDRLINALTVIRDVHKQRSRRNRTSTPYV